MKIDRARVEETADRMADLGQQVIELTRGQDMVVMVYRPLALGTDDETLLWAVDTNVSDPTVLATACQSVLLGMASGRMGYTLSGADPETPGGGESDG